MICRKALPDRSIKEEGLRSNVSMPRQIRAKLCLDESIGAEQLVVRRESLKGGGAASEAALFYFRLVSERCLADSGWTQS